MAVEQKAAVTEIPASPASVVFYYDTEGIIYSVTLRSTYRAKMVKNQEGVSQLDDVAISPQERSIVLEILEQAIYDIFGKMLKITEGVTDPIFFNSGYSPSGGANVEKCLNPFFTGAATSWTLGAGAAYGTNNVIYTAATATTKQTADIVLVSGKTYKVTTVISSATAGSIKAKLGAVVGDERSTAGTFTSYLVATASGALEVGLVTTGFTGVVESHNVELLEEGTYSGGIIKDNAAYNENVLLNIDKKIGNCIRYYILAEWYIACSMGDDAKLNRERYNDYIKQVENLTFELRKPLMT